jgi:hypothetical protein
MNVSKLAVHDVAAIEQAVHPMDTPLELRDKGSSKD